MSKRLGGIIGCQDKTSSWHLNGFPCSSSNNWVNSIMSGRSPPLYCALTYYINRHAGTRNKTKTMSYIIEQGSNNIVYDNSTIEP